MLLETRTYLLIMKYTKNLLNGIVTSMWHQYMIFIYHTLYKK